MILAISMPEDDLIKHQTLLNIARIYAERSVMNGDT
jgi:hypothetical protein